MASKVMDIVLSLFFAIAYFLLSCMSSFGHWILKRDELQRRPRMIKREKYTLFGKVTVFSVVAASLREVLLSKTCFDMRRFL